MIHLISEQSYHQAIRNCLQLNPEIDLSSLLDKLKHAGNTNWDSNSFKINLKNLEGEDLEVNIKPELYFHPEFGHCETLNLESTDEFLWLDIFIDRFESMIIFFHDSNILPDLSDSHAIIRQEETIRVDIEMEMEIQPPLKRLPCTESHFLTCKDTQIHLELKEKHSCRASIMKSGYYLKNLIEENLPACDNKKILEVRIQTYLDSKCVMSFPYTSMHSTRNISN